MKVVQSHSGDYLKNGRRYRAVPYARDETPLSVREEMLSKGYEYAPLSILDLEKARKLTEFALRRWTQENSGIEINGVLFLTDERTRLVFAGYRAKAEANEKFVVPNYKLPDGQFIELTTPVIVAVEKAIATHVQDAFDKEESLSKEIIGCLSEDEVKAIKWDSADPDPQPTGSGIKGAIKARRDQIAKG